MARKMRAWLRKVMSSTLVMPASAPVAIRPADAAQQRAVLCRRPLTVKAAATAASGSISGYGTMPVMHRRHADVEHRADDQRGEDADRHVALRLLGLLGVRRDRVEADVGEEDDRPPRT